MYNIHIYICFFSLSMRAVLSDFGRVFSVLGRKSDLASDSFTGKSATPSTRESATGITEVNMPLIWRSCFTKLI